MSDKRMDGLLALADGTVIRGAGAGAACTVVGELVFQTGMVGYQEAMTDPSYAGQMLIYTYPLVGNYGAGLFADQSAKIHATGIIVRDLLSGSHRDATLELEDVLRTQGVPAISGVDTRLLTRRVRSHGVLPAALWVGEADEQPPIEELHTLASSLDYDSCDFVAECSTPSLVWHPPSRPEAPRVALIDYGVKLATLRHLREAGAGVWLVPASMTAEEVLALGPDGVLLSNGPGDPARLGYAVDTVRGLVGQGNIPIFGICLGHQLLSLAAGAHTSKMRFGHRGINQPVLDTATSRVSITTQNHGYMVDPGSVPPDYRVTHTNLNDGTVEGVAHISKPVWGVQWHPESHPGPDDTRGLIDLFLSDAEAVHA